MRSAPRRVRAGRLALALGTAVALWLACAAAIAGDLIVGRGWLEDPTGTLALDDVRERPAQPFEGILARGYGDSTWWIRLRVDPGEARGPTGQPLVLSVSPAQIDEVELFDPLARDRGRRVTGDRHDRRADELRSLDLNFVVPRGDAPRDLWLRVRTTGSMTMRTELLPFDERLDADRVRELLRAGALSLLALPLAWAVLHGLASRERLVGLFVAKQAAVLLHVLAYGGYLRLVLGGRVPPAAIDLAGTLVHLAMPALGLAFDIAFLRACGAPAPALRLLRALFVALPASFALVALGHTSQGLAMQIAGIVIGAPMIAAVAMATDLRPRGSDDDEPAVPRFLATAVYVLSAPTVMLTGLTLLGTIALPGVPMRAALLHGLASGLTMVAVLHLRTLRGARRQARSEARLAATRMQVQKEREHREHNERLLSMLAHELRTPLASVRMLLARGTPSPEGVTRILRSVSDMNGVIERCLQTVRLDDRRVRADVTRCDVGALLADLRLGLPDPARVRIDTVGPTVARSDPALLKVVLSNLVENALKYGARDDAVTVTMRRARRGELEGLELTVRNPPGDAGWPDPAQLFRKYYRAPGAQRQTGSGLGLYLVAGLVAQLGGAVRYVPDERQVRFELWVPG